MLLTDLVEFNMPYIYSTLSSDNSYCAYTQAPEIKDNRGIAIQGLGPRSILRKVLIKGGANVMPARSQANTSFLTPKGFVTKVSDEELEFLQTIQAFKDHVKNGFLKVDKSSIDIDQAVKSLQPEDQSAPKTPNSPEFKDQKVKAGGINLPKE